MRLVDADQIPFMMAITEKLESTGEMYANKKDIDALPTVEVGEEVKRLEKYIDDLNAVIKLKEGVIKEKQHKNELRYRDGIIYGLKYAIRYHGTGGGNDS